MKLTTKSEYAILALIYIARHSENGSYVKIEQICKEYDIPQNYLEQLFLHLKQNQLVQSKRGVNGGYKLAQSPENITLAQVIRMMDGALAPSDSVSKFYFDHTPVEEEKKIVQILQDIRDYISDKLEHTSLKDVA